MTVTTRQSNLLLIYHDPFHSSQMTHPLILHSHLFNSPNTLVIPSLDQQTSLQSSTGQPSTNSTEIPKKHTTHLKSPREPHLGIQIFFFVPLPCMSSGSRSHRQQRIQAASPIPCQPKRLPSIVADLRRPLYIHTFLPPKQNTHYVIHSTHRAKKPNPICASKTESKKCPSHTFRFSSEASHI